MKRTRIVALVSTLCICLALFATGVWAIASTVIFGLNGNLKYYPEGVYVELSGQVYRGDSLDTLEPITTDPRFTLEKQTNFDNSTGEPSANFPIADWNIGSLPFAPQLRYIKIEVKITNYSDFEILGTPTITGIDTADSNITVTDPGYVYAYIGETGTYELILQLKDNATEISSKNITISFDIEKAVANYSYFNIVDNQIKGLDTEHYKAPYPEILIVPGVSEGGTTPLSIRDETSSDYAFKGLNSSIVILQDGLTSTGSHAFRDCSSLTSIEIPSSVTSIGDAAFAGCSSLTSIEISSSVTSIGNSAFSNCSSLTSIEIPSSVTSIDDYAFRGCSSLTSIEIPSSVTSIGGFAFRDCSSLTSIEIQSGVTSIGVSAFEGCRSLTSIKIPSSVKSIGTSVFKGCSSLTSIKIPSSVTRIGSGAFRECSSLSSIEIPSSVTSIGTNVFYGCSGLSSITFGENSKLASIGYNAFDGCSSLTSIEIPSGVTTIRDDAFSGCSKLSTITIQATTPPSLGSSAIPSNVNKIYVPSGSVSTYQSASGWSSYSSKISAIQ